MKNLVFALVVLPLFPCLPVFVLFDTLNAVVAHWSSELACLLTLCAVGVAAAAAAVAVFLFLRSVFFQSPGSGVSGAMARPKGTKAKIIRYGGLYAVLGVLGHVVSNLLFAWYGSFYRNGFLNGFYSAISERSRGGVMFMLLVASIVFYLGLGVYIVLRMRRRAREC